MHNCTDSSVQLTNSRPMYMSSSDSDSHIIAVEGGEQAEHTDRRGVGFQEQSKVATIAQEEVTAPVTFFISWSQRVKTSTLLL